MSFAISNISGPALQELPDRSAKPLPQPTPTQEMHQLEGSGESTRQIAANLGLPVATVDSTLGYSISTEIVGDGNNAGGINPTLGYPISTDPQASSAQTAILVAGTSALTPPFETKA
jgi:hypothetical protein